MDTRANEITINGLTLHDCAVCRIPIWHGELCSVCLDNLARAQARPIAGGSDGEWYATTAQAHADADARCGRAWSCTCGACRAARKAGWRPVAPIAGGSDRMERTETMLKAIHRMLERAGFRPYVGGIGPDTWTNGTLFIDTNEDVVSGEAAWRHADTPVSVRASGDDAESLFTYLRGLRALRG
jgi:hypothetical protein